MGISTWIQLASAIKNLLIYKCFKSKIKIIKTSEPFQLLYEGDYNLNVLKEVIATDSFLGMDENKRECQNKESQLTCSTKNYLDTLRRECNRIPFNIKQDQVV